MIYSSILMNFEKSAESFVSNKIKTHKSQVRRAGKEEHLEE
jgi:hypothetical protein